MAYVDLTGLNHKEQPTIDLPSFSSGGQQVTAHSHDDALTLATASLLYSRAYMWVFGVVISALLAIAWVVVRDDAMLAVLIVVGVVSWGWSSYSILSHNREQGLHHSPTGIEHARIESQVELGKYAIDKHIYILERQWEREDGVGSVRQIPGD